MLTRRKTLLREDIRVLLKESSSFRAESCQQKPTNKEDPLLPLMLEEAIRLHCQVEALLASLPGDYNQESLQELGLIKPAAPLNLTAE